MPTSTRNAEVPLSVDVNVVSYVVGNHPNNADYSAVLAGESLALSYFTDAELEAAEWTSARLDLVNDFRKQCLHLGNPNTLTRVWFCRAKRVRARLALDRGVEREDLWMIAQSAEYGLPVVSHDRNAIRIVAGLGLPFRTLLDKGPLVRLFERDQAKLQANPVPSDVQPRLIPPSP